MRHRPRALLAAAAAVLALAIAPACATRHNPSFDTSLGEAQAELGSIDRRSVPLERPVIVAAGFMDPGFGVSSIATRLRRAAEDPAMVIEVPFFTTPTFELARARMIEKLERSFPSDDPLQTIEVDAIGISMGGLVARFAAMDDPDARAAGIKRLRIRTLFTLGTPHAGAKRAMETIAFDERVVDMRAGSPFLQRLDEAWPARDYTLVAYTRLGDDIVGTTNALDPDGRGWWLDPPPLSFSHLDIQSDPRIIADIIRRLTGQPSLTMDPPAPIPRPPDTRRQQRPTPETTQAPSPPDS